MRKMFLAISLLTFAGAALSGCKGTTGTAAVAALERARPLDNFGEILKPKAASEMRPGATPARSLGSFR